MLRNIFLVVHVAGMVVIVLTGILLMFGKRFDLRYKKRMSIILMSTSHTQLLTGFVLFLINYFTIQFGKIGVKIILAATIATLATIYKKKISTEQIPSPFLLPSITMLAVAVTAIAYGW